jgi:phosphomevalonate kinase
MAINRRAIARVTPVDTAWNSVSAPAYSSVEGRFVAGGSGPDWLQGKDDFELVDAVWRSVGPDIDGSVSIELDTRGFFDTASGEKLGLGSSAALTVALTAALSQSNDVSGDALRAHRVFQSGAGSGVDIAASAQGGLLEYRMQGARTAPIRWPEGLVYRIVWTGVPASTAGKLSRLQGASHRRSLDALVDAAVRTARAWRSASELFRALPDYIERLRQFSEDHELGIFDGGHDTLLAEAHAASLIYKPCGAGGGDVGILLGMNAEQLDEFLVGRPASGCRVLEGKLAMQGVTWERS